MSVIAGYQSDVDLQDINFVGDFPVENSLGGFGIATGINDDFELKLDPPLTEYRDGLELQTRFNHANVGAVRINVNQLGFVPVVKEHDGAVYDLDANDLNDTRIYTLVFDGAGFQINIPVVDQASTDKAGAIKIARQSVVDLGQDNEMAVTAKTLFSFVSDKITGLWEDKGLIDASTSPDFPPGQKGDAYTVSASGVIGTSNVTEGIEVQERDVLYCINDNPGGTIDQVSEDWNAIQSNLVKATEAIAGIARIATDQQVDDGDDDQTIVTPKKLDNKLTNMQATELVRGLARIVTLNDLLAGIDDSKFITALKLSQFLNTRVATETKNGLAKIATQAMVDAGFNNSSIVSPLRLENRLNQFVNHQEILRIQPEHIGSKVYHTPGRNRYTAINGNLIITRDIRLKPTAPIPATVSGHILNFPKPLESGAPFSHQLRTHHGNSFFISIHNDGRLLIYGTFTNPNEELLLNINPYLAKFPLEYHSTQPS